MGDAGSILVVDDDDDHRDTLGALVQAIGYPVTAVPSAEAAIAELASERSYALVLSDVRLSGMWGTRLADHIKQIYPAIPIILVTGFGDLAEPGSGYVALQKPVSVDRLRAVLHDALG